jgi:hypothetical protein
VKERLELMRKNPFGDWRIPDIEALCKEFGIDCKPPRGGGSHYKVSHPRLTEKLTVPFKRPIQTVSIRRLVSFVDAVRELS